MTNDPFRDAFERMAPHPVDPATARAELGALTPGFQRARRFHRVRLGAATAVCALGLAVGGPAVLAAVGSDGSSPATDFSSQDGQGPDIGDAAEVDSDGEDLDTTSGSDQVETPGHLRQDDSPDPVDDESFDTTGEVDDGDSSDTSDDSASTPPVADAAGVTEESDGGSVVYKFVDGALVLVDYRAAPGFTEALVKDQTHEIKVRFSDLNVYYEIEIEIENGVAQAKVKGPKDLESSDDKPGGDEHDESDDTEEPHSEEG